MRKIFNKDLQTLITHQGKIIDLVIQTFNQTTHLIHKPMSELADQIISASVEIDENVKDLQKEAYRIIALQQPVAADLRLVFALLNISLELKSISEHFTTIAKRVNRTQVEFQDHEDILLIINKMLTHLQAMLEPLFLIIENGDIERASILAQTDSQVNALFMEVFEEATLRMNQNPTFVQAGIFIIDIATSLERIGDYLTNSFEHVLFLETGSLVQLN